MKKLEIHAYDMEDAKMQAFQEGITVIMDATKPWIKAGSPILTKELDVFMVDYLESKNLFNFEGAGAILTVTKGIEIEKENPYHLVNIIRKGKCKLKRGIEIRKRSNDEVVGIAPNKAAAMKLAKKLVKQYRESLYGKTVYTANDIDFEMQYNPSVRERLGRYIVFGVEDADVRVNKQRRRDYK